MSRCGGRMTAVSPCSHVGAQDAPVGQQPGQIALAWVEGAGGIVLVDRTGELTQATSAKSGRTYPAEALWSLSLPTYDAGEATCPGCAAGLPLEAPGSSGLSAA